METQTEYARIAERAEKFFRAFRRVMLGLAALAVAVVLAGIAAVVVANVKVAAVP